MLVSPPLLAGSAARSSTRNALALCGVSIRKREREGKPWESRLRSPDGRQLPRSFRTRLLSTILRQAVDDQLLYRSPAQVRGASVEHAPERPIVTVAELAELVEVADERIRSLILLGAWCSLRLSELLGLQRRHIDSLHGTVTDEQQRQDHLRFHADILPTR